MDELFIAKKKQPSSGVLERSKFAIGVAVEGVGDRQVRLLPDVDTSLDTMGSFRRLY